MTDSRQLVIAFILGVAVTIGLALLSVCVNSNATAEQSAGCPLDATTYDSPKWMPECVRCQKVADRVTGKSWWLLTMSGGAHVVLPLDVEVDQ